MSLTESQQEIVESMVSRVRTYLKGELLHIPCPRLLRIVVDAPGDLFSVVDLPTPAFNQALHFLEGAIRAQCDKVQAAVRGINPAKRDGALAHYVVDFWEGHGVISFTLTDGDKRS